MLRWAAVGLALGGFTLWGAWASAGLREKKELLEELTDAVRSLQAGMRHTNRPLSELLPCCGGRRTGPFFAAVGAGVAAGQSAWDAYVETEEEIGCFLALEAADRRRVEGFFAALGRSDRASQQQSAGLILSALSDSAGRAAAAYGQKGRMYRSLGLLAGVGASILLW